MKLRIGVAGLGRAFTLMLPPFRLHPGVELVAATDPRREACERFASEFGARAHSSVEALCEDPAVEAVYIATPHAMHAAHACAAASRGKHVLIEKPMAVTLAECDAIIAAADKARVHVVVGPSHSFDLPIRRAREIVESGELGQARMVTALNFTDFLYRPRRPEELDTSQGGGVFFSQGAHHVDVVRYVLGDRVSSVRASAGSWDPRRPTEGAYAAHLRFAGGAFATLTYSGYGRFDSDVLMDGIGELGHAAKAQYGAARRQLAAIAGSEADAKSARNYGGPNEKPAAPVVAHEHFGPVFVSCERGDIRPMPTGIVVHGELESRVERWAPPAIPRREVLDELIAAVRGSQPPLHDARWGRDTLEVCLAMLASAREDREVRLRD
jgi:phthalate 4,5-cis-dihydrodiol dehydrogenase